MRGSTSLTAVWALLAAIGLMAGTAMSAVTIFSEDFESPVVTGYDQGTLPDNGNWIGASAGYRSNYWGLVNEDTGGFTDPNGAQAMAFRYTNSGVTTVDGAIGDFLPGLTYTVSFDAVMDGGKNDGTPYNVRFYAAPDGVSRTDCRNDNGFTLLKAQTGNATADGLYTTVSFDFTVDPVAYAGIIGQDITIRLDGATTTANIDNVRVTVPEGAYWDLNGTDAGAGGATPSGTWNATDANWNPNFDGTGTPTAWTPGQTATFSAGDDATGTYTVTVDGTQDIGGLSFWNGDVTLSGGTALRMTADSSVYVGPGLTATVGTAISEDANSRPLTKAGPGTLILSGANTYTGGTLVGVGVVQFDSSAAMAGTGRNVTVNEGGAVVLDASFDVATTLAGRIDAASTGAIAADNHAATDFDFDAAGLTTASLGAVGNVNYTGTLTPSGTTYRLGGGGGTLSLNSALTTGYDLEVKSPGTVQLNGFDANVSTLNGVSGAVLQNGSATNISVIVDNSTNCSYSGLLADGSGGGTLKLVKTGSANLSLENANTYSGGTELNAGQVNNVIAGSFGTGDITATGDSQISPKYNNYPTISNNIAVEPGVTLDILSGNQYYAFATTGVVSGDTTATLRVSNNTSNGASNRGYDLAMLNPNNTFEGAITTKGILRVASLPDSNQPITINFGGRDIGIELPSGSASPLTFANRQIRIATSKNYKTFFRNNNGDTNNVFTIDDMVIYSGTDAMTLALQGNNTGDNTISSDIANGTVSALSVRKENGGKWILTGNNTYTGATTVAGGTLVIEGSTDSSDATVTSGSIAGGGSVKSLTINNNAGFIWSYGDGGDHTMDITGGDLTLSDTWKLTLVDLGGDDPFISQKYDLFTYSGTASLGAFTVDSSGITDWDLTNLSIVDDGLGRVYITGIGMEGGGGDTNGDGVVDAADYINLKRNLGTPSGASLADGDLDGDGDVDWDDLTAMTTALNAAAGANTIPEPATMGLLAFGALALIRRRRK